MLPDVDALATLGGALQDYSPVIDPTRDRPAAGANVGYADAAAATHTVLRGIFRLTWNGAGTPTIAYHDEVWNGSTNGVPNNAAPVAARTSTGVATITYPSTVVDEIGASNPGGNGNPHNVNLQAVVAMVEGGTPLHVQAAVTSANVVTIYLFNTSFVAADATTGVTISVMVR